MIAGALEMLARLLRIEFIGLKIRIGVLGSFKERLLAEILVVHQVPIQPLEVEKVLQRNTEFLVLKDRRFEIHMQAGYAVRHVEKDARASEPAMRRRRERIVLVPGLGRPFDHHVQLTKPDIVELSLRRYHPQMDLVEIILSNKIALLVAPPIWGSLEGDRLPALYGGYDIGADGNLPLIGRPRDPILVQHPGMSRHRPYAGIFNI